MAGTFFEFSEVVTVAKKSEKKKHKNKKMKGGKGNEEEGKRPSDGISAAEGMMIRKSDSTGRPPKRSRDTASSRLLILIYDACSADLLEPWGREGGRS